MDLDTIGHLAYAAIGAGTLLLALGHGAGWPLRLAGGLVWAWLGVQLEMSSILIWEGVFVLIDSVGCFQWVRARFRAATEKTRTSSG